MNNGKGLDLPSPACPYIYRNIYRNMMAPPRVICGQPLLSSTQEYDPLRHRHVITEISGYVSTMPPSFCMLSSRMFENISFYLKTNGSIWWHHLFL